jgi:hypothetical protein
MSRLKDTILGQKGYGLHAQAPVVDLRNGGQNGPMPDIGAYVSSSAYVRRNLIALLIEAPRGFQDLEDPATYIETLKALVELHPKSIEGLQSTLTVDFVENAVGGAGEMQEDIANVTRARSNPTFVWGEKYGKPVSQFLRSWITDIIMDPATKYPTVISRGIRKPQDLLPDYTGMTVLFFEPDPTHSKVMEAWLCTNMMPKTSGDITGRRDLTQAGESIDYSVEFTALTQQGVGVKQFAQRLLDSMNLSGMNPNLQKAFIQQVSADVKAADKGYTETLASEATNHV